MARTINTEADLLLDTPVSVLDRGFVRLVDYLGGDKRVVESARVSYGQQAKTVREDQGLINYLMRNAHTSPFEQVELVFHVKAPIAIIRQWFRHRMASVNEISGRYAQLPNEFYIPGPDEIRAQSTINKQVGEGSLWRPAAEHAAERIEMAAREAYEHYEYLLARGVAREQARMVLPVGIYSEFYWKQDLHNLFGFLRLRLDWHAQAEIRAYAEVMAPMARAVAPLCYEAFEEHVLQAVKFSKTEAALLRQHMRGYADPREQGTTLLSGPALGIGVDSAGHPTQLDILDTLASVEGWEPKAIAEFTAKLKS